MGATSYFTLFTVLSVFTALFSIIYQAYLASSDLRSLTTILQNLKTLEYEFKVDKPRVAIGYGSCSDLYVKAVDFLNFTSNVEESLMQATFNVDDITNENEFLHSFAYYFQRGAAAEWVRGGCLSGIVIYGFYWIIFQTIHYQQDAVPTFGEISKESSICRTSMDIGRKCSGDRIQTGRRGGRSCTRGQNVIQVSCLLWVNEKSLDGGGYDSFVFFFHQIGTE